MRKWFRLFKVLTSIREGTAVNGTIAEITANAELKGSNLWMLFCSAILASIGLDLNSTAVIIGAMLISPLMSPILAVGLSIAIFDKKLLRDALQALVIAVVMSLGTSSLYFLISPLSQLTQELSARTTPTLLDIGVAFFGGIAGLVAGSRRTKTSAIPGVAIATALMPPVCTAGFGIAHADSSIFLGAFYLFFINAFFISLATYLVCVLLRFPQKAELDVDTSIWVRRSIVAGALVVAIPSGLILYDVLRKARIERGARDFVAKAFQDNERQPIRWEVDRTQTPELLKVFIVGRPVEGVELTDLRSRMAEFGIGDLDLSCVQLNLARNEIQKLSATVADDVADRLRIISAVDEQQENEISELRAEIDRLRAKTDPDLLLIEELRRHNPAIISAAWKEGDPRVLSVSLAADSDTATVKSDVEKLVKHRRPNESISVDVAVEASK